LEAKKVMCKRETRAVQATEKGGGGGIPVNSIGTVTFSHSHAGLGGYTEVGAPESRSSRGGVSGAKTGRPSTFDLTGEGRPATRIEEQSERVEKTSLRKRSQSTMKGDVVMTKGTDPTSPSKIAALVAQSVHAYRCGNEGTPNLGANQKKEGKRSLGGVGRS